MLNVRDHRHGHPGIAVVGCGRWGANHLRAWSDLGHLRVACDPRPAALEAAAQRFPDLKLCRSVEEVLSSPEVDAVVIATPAAGHAELASMAVLAGKDVLVEKPLALDLEDAEALVALAAKTEAVLMVGHVLEYHPAFLELRRLVAEGVLGKLLYVYSHRLNFGTVRTEESAMWSYAPHDLALLLRLIGTTPVDVTCRGGAYLTDDVADVTVMSLRFPGQVQAHVFVSWLHPFKEHRFVVVGDRQMAVVDDTAPWDDKLVLLPHRINWIDGHVPVAERAEAVPVAVERKEPLLAECEHFLECIRTRATPLTDGPSGLRVLRLLDAGDQSLRNGGLPVAPDGSTGDRPWTHPTANVDEGAVVGERTRVWHHAHVMSGAQVGRDCMLGQNAFVAGGVRIGDGVRIQNNVSVYDGVELEDGVFCGPSMVFTNVASPRAEVNRKNDLRRTLVKRGATLGANSTIVCGVTVGRYAFVAAGAVVTRDVPDHALVMGVPARRTGWVCRCGEKLGFASAHGRCLSCGLRYQKDGEEIVVLTDP